MSEFKNIGPLKLIYEKLEYCVAVQHEKFITVDDCDLDREKAVALRNWLTEAIGDNGLMAEHICRCGLRVEPTKGEPEF